MVSNKSGITYLVRWSVKEIDSDGTHHFVGFDSKNRVSVVTPCIVTFNRHLKIGITKNESIYSLCGEPLIENSLEQEWTSWCKSRDIHSWEDITEEYVGK